jgi:hypothetical protein
MTGKWMENRGSISCKGMKFSLNRHVQTYGVVCPPSCLMITGILYPLFNLTKFLASDEE